MTAASDDDYCRLNEILMVYRFNLWDPFQHGGYWWMAMVNVWLLFSLLTALGAAAGQHAVVRISRKMGLPTWRDERTLEGPDPAACRNPA
jgi:hypothetical protein